MAPVKKTNSMTVIELAKYLHSTPVELTKLSKAGHIAKISPEDTLPFDDTVRRFCVWLRDPIVTIPEAGAMVGMANGVISQMIASGHIKRRDSDNALTVLGFFKGLINFYRDNNRRSNKSAVEDQLKKSRAEEIELRSLERAGRLVPIERLEETVDNLCGSIRAEFSGLPARVTRDIPLRRVLEKELHAILKRLAETSLQEALRLEADSALANAVTGDDPGRMGDSEPDLSGGGGNTRAA